MNKSNYRLFLVLAILIFVTPACNAVSSSPTRWEYKVELICKGLQADHFMRDELENYEGTCLAASRIEQRLNVLGKEGWELVVIHTPFAGYGKDFPFTESFLGVPYDRGRLVLKRPAQ